MTPLLILIPLMEIVVAITAIAVRLFTYYHPRRVAEWRSDEATYYIWVVAVIVSKTLNRSIVFKI
jgi:hypothetical protein